LAFLLLPFWGNSQTQKVLNEDFHFLATDGEVQKISQSNDSLFIWKCYYNKPCLPSPKNRYKIWAAKQSGQYTILKLELVDSIPFSNNPKPENRYGVLALQTISSNQLGFLNLASGLTKQQMNTFQVNEAELQDKFFFTYFSDSFLKEMDTYKKITKKEEAQEIIKRRDGETFKYLLEKYSKTETHDMYNAGLSAELINLSCIQLGYNPMGAGRKIRALLKQ
jgi:hypothetical protein